MTNPVEPTIPAPAEKASDRALIFFSRPARWIVAGGCLVVAELRILWDAPIDALSVGLLGAAVLVIFSRITQIGWGGVTASFLEKELDQVTGRVERVELSREPVAPPPPPAKPLPGPVVVQPGTAGLVAEGEAPEVSVQATDHLQFRETAQATLIAMPPTNPTERVLWAVEQIRIELIVLAGNGGHLRERLEWRAYRSNLVAKNLARAGVIPQELAEITKVVNDARNELVHSRLSAKALAQADTLGLELLQKLRDVKRQYIRVGDPDPQLFHDDELSVLYEATSGVMLVTIDERGRTLNTSVYPRSTEYEKGRFVSWEWDLNRSFEEEAYYQNPITNQPQMTWSESATFIGRQYPEEWRLEFRLDNPDAGLA